MARKINWGILSTANIVSRRFMPAISKSDRACAYAVASRDAERAKVFAAEFDTPRHFGSYQELIDDPEVEVVYVALPNEWHAEWSIKAARAGKHVLCEKPMALDARQALEVADECRKNGVLLMEAFMYRLNPRTRMIKEVIDSGTLGEVRAITSEFGFMLEPRHASRLIPGKGGGSLMDIGCYCVNFCRCIFGAEPISVLASAHNHPDVGCDMTFSGVLEFTGGRVGMISSSFETAFHSTARVAGTQSILRIEKPFNPSEQGDIGFDVQMPDGKTQSFEVEAVEQFLVEIDSFSDSVREGKPVALDPYEDAIPNIRVIDALRASAESGRRVEVERHQEA